MSPTDRAPTPKTGLSLNLLAIRSRLVIVTLLVLAAGSLAHAQGTQSGRIHVKIVGGKLVASCDIASPTRRLPVNLFVEFETPCRAQIHNRAAAGLQIETAAGESIPFTIHFPAMSIPIDRREHGDEDEFAEFTKYWSHEIGENAVVGTIGSDLLREYHVVIDLGAGHLALSPPREREQDAGVEPTDDRVSIPLTVENELVWLPVRFADGSRAAMAIGTAAEDSTLDEVMCDDLGAPAGDVGPVRSGELVVNEFVALRPAEVLQVHPDGAAGVLGLNFLANVRIEIDRVNRRAVVERTRTPDYPAGDLAYFHAMVDEDTAALVEFLEAFPTARLAPEASELLLELALGEANVDLAQDAVRRVNTSEREDLRATRMHDLMLELSNEGHSDLVIYAGELGVESGRDDRYPNAVHEIHAKMGAVLLDLGDGRRAWKHLLSAAFGLPDDGMTNLNLGRFYESEGRLRRAFSRYLQAVIKPESGPLAVEGLRRVQEQMPGGERFSVDLVERMIAGKVRNFGAAVEYEPPDDATGRVALVEFFTNAHLGDASRGAIGGALANQGLQSYFPPEHVVFLSYHLPEPAPEPLVNELALRRAQRLRVPGPWVHRINGRSQTLAAGRWRDAEALYLQTRRRVVDELKTASAYRMTGQVRLDGDRVDGSVTVIGPARPNLRVHVILAEKGVLFPGKTQVVIHRMLARAAVLDPDGTEFTPLAGMMRIPFTTTLSEIMADQDAFLTRLESAGAIGRLDIGIDPDQVRIVAFVEDRSTGRILQALQITPHDAEDEG